MPTPLQLTHLLGRTIQFAAALLLISSSVHAVETCQIDVVEEGSGWPVPLVELRTTHHVRFVSDNAGVIALDLPELMGVQSWFHVAGHGYEVPKDGFGYRGVRLTPMPGKRLTVKVKRLLPAKRLGRITGGGIFGECQKLGEESEWREQGILGCDSVQTAVHNGRLFWAWGDTVLARYPLGLFHMISATTNLRPLSSFEPPIRLRYTYFTDETGRPRVVGEMPGAGPTWISGYVSLPDKNGTQHLVGTYIKVKPPLTAYESGLCVWNEEEERFERHRVLWTKTPEAPEPPLSPDGHPVFWEDASGKAWVLFGDPFPRLKCAARFEAWRDPQAWQKLQPQQCMQSASGDEQVTPHRGSIAWNSYRKKWVAVFTQMYGKPSALGEIWYAESDRPTGPWGPAVKVVSHANYTFYNPRLHPEFTPADSPILLFEGTYTQQFAKKPAITPRHDYNQILYRLDLDDPALSQDWKTPPELNPVGEVHIPIGLPNSLDSLKTFVEAEGGFSPGVGSFGVSFWVYDSTESKLWSPTMEGVAHTHGLCDGRALIPWSEWTAGALRVRTEVCEARRETDEAVGYLVGARATLSNPTDQTKQVALYVALRPLGPAGNAVTDLAVNDEENALLADGHPAIVANSTPSAAGVSGADTIGYLAARGKMPAGRRATSLGGDCSGALRFDLSISAGKTLAVGIVCPVHAGRRAVRHKWVPRVKNLVDDAVPNSDADGVDQPDLGVEHYRKVRVDDLFSEAQAFWDEFYSGSRIEVPDARWSRGFDVMLAHAGLCMNEGAADVAVTNYTVFNRDGMYIANMMQKAGLPQLSEEVIDFFLQSPFNGRPFPEADNPGQILWSMGQHWQLTRDEAWLRRVYPAAEKLARMIEYYRTTEGPHWVSLNSLDFGDTLPESQRMVLEPGRCDGHHPEYTEAFDIAGLRTMGEFAMAIGESADAKVWRDLADRLFADYDERFGKELRKSYGGYCVLWPCRLYPSDRGPAHDQFKDVGKQELSTWRYFAPATAHQGLLAGNRQAGYATVNAHLDHPQMRDWFAFDEGGKSGSGGWHHLKTTWTHSKTEPDRNHAVAMPHGWAIAEVWLLMRDCLLTESDGYLKLLAGASPQWFTDPKGMRVENLPTTFGRCSFRYAPTDAGAVLTFTGDASPPSGFEICLPAHLNAQASCDGGPVAVPKDGRFFVPANARRVELIFPDSR